MITCLCADASAFPLKYCMYVRIIKVYEMLFNNIAQLLNCEDIDFACFIMFRKQTALHEQVLCCSF